MMRAQPEASPRLSGLEGDKKLSEMPAGWDGMGPI